jgi:hypothetical protein
MNADAFGASMGRALQQFGVGLGDVAQVSAKLYEEQQAQNALKWFNDAAAQARKKMYDDDDAIMKRSGSQAMGASKEWDDWALATGENAKRTLVDQYGRRAGEAFEKLWSSHSRSLGDATARYELQQRKGFRDETEKGLIATAAADAANNYLDPEFVERSIGTVRRAILANAAGDPPEMVEAKLRQASSAVHSGIVQRMAVSDPIKAMEYYKANANSFDGGDHVKIQKLLEVPYERAQANEYVRQRTSISAPARALGVVTENLETPTGTKLTTELLQTSLQRYEGDIPAAVVAATHGDDAATKWLASGRDYAAIPDGDKTKAFVETVQGRYGDRAGGNKPLDPPISPAAEIRMGGLPPAGQRMTRDNWSLSFYKPQDMLPPNDANVFVDARAAKMADELGRRFFEETGKRVGINDDAKANVPTPFGVSISSQGRRRGARDPEDNPGAPGSQHTQGRAFDFQVQNLTDDEKKRFLSMAKELGFTGIGYYEGKGGHLHLDTGAARSWGTAPAWAQAADASAPRLAQTAVNPQKFDLEAELAEADARFGDRPDVLTRVRQGLIVEANRRDRIEKQRDQEVLKGAWSHVAKGGSIADMPPEMVTNLYTRAPQAVPAMERFEERRSKGQKIETDYAVYARVAAMDDDGVRKTTVEELIPYLGPTELKEFAKRKADIDKADRGFASGDVAGTQTRNEIVRSAIAGSDFAKMEGKPENAKRAGMLQARVDQFITSFAQANKRAPRSDEIRAEVDRLMTPTSIDRPNIGTGNYYAFELGSASDNAVKRGIGEKVEADKFTPVAKLTEVPPADLVFLKDAYTRERGQLPKEDKAVELYNAARRAQIGGLSDPPPEDRREIVSALTKKYGRAPTATEIQRAYSAHVLRYLPRGY